MVPPSVIPTSCGPQQSVNEELVRPAHVRTRRGAETYSLTCQCGKPIEISTRPPYRCNHCIQALEIRWGA
jgi:hypothetical protein